MTLVLCKQCLGSWILSSPSYLLLLRGIHKLCIIYSVAANGMWPHFLFVVGHMGCVEEMRGRDQLHACVCVCICT